MPVCALEPGCSAGAAARCVAVSALELRCCPCLCAHLETCVWPCALWKLSTGRAASRCHSLFLDAGAAAGCRAPSFAIWGLCWMPIPGLPGPAAHHSNPRHCSPLLAPCVPILDAPRLKEVVLEVGVTALLRRRMEVGIGLYVFWSWSSPPTYDCCVFF